MLQFATLVTMTTQYETKRSFHLSKVQIVLQKLK